MRVQESYNPAVVGVNGSFKLAGPCVSGFIAVTAGTLTITDANGLVIVNAVPLTAGVYLPLPIYWPALLNGTVTLAGGASGTLLI